MMYSFNQVIEGMQFTVFFVSTFTGHTHPFTPYNPIDINEAYSANRKTFYQAWYKGSTPEKAGPKGLPSSPKLYYLEKYWLVFHEAEPPTNHCKEEGRYFHSAKETKQGFEMGGAIEPITTTTVDLFYSYVVNKKGAVVESNYIRKHLIDKYSYSYGSNGLYESVKTEMNVIPE